MTGEAFNKACCEGKICLAINNTDGDIDSFSDRILRYMATKSFVITEYSEGLNNYFPNGIENCCFDYFENIERLNNLLKAYGDDSFVKNYRKEVANRGYDFVLKNHTWKIFAENVLKLANEEIQHEG